MARLTAPPARGPRVPVRVWARDPPRAALEQLARLARQPYVVGQVAGMPDLHVAQGVAVGTVFAAEGVVVPAALGDDLGCGVCAVRFDVPAAGLDRRGLERLLLALGGRIPVGEAVQRGAGPGRPGPDDSPLATRALERVRARLVRRQLGTLGGGNHFVELDRGAGGDLWLVVHAGSRGLGAAIAAHHRRAAAACGEGELPGLRVEDRAGRDCLADLDWAVRFARANRAAILGAARELVAEQVGQGWDADSFLDVPHNLVREEEHLGRRLWIHRKGAQPASAGQRALIPGSMGTATYLVEGRGEPASFASASHGAGRVLTRGAARASIHPRDLAVDLRRVVYDPRWLSSLVEEAPDAYRDIRAVLEDQADLVRPLLRLEPLLVLKG
jgi:tRNA-splicing ligase RtcB (3'-phosphate/5'-hydroxy nucleic acid ligase)